MVTLLGQIRSAALSRHIPIMEEEPAWLLAETVRKRLPRKILEIGTAIGYSGLIMLNESPKATLTTIEKDAARLIEARNNFEQAGVLSRVRTIEDDAVFAVSVMEGVYDFILLDGPKGQYRAMLPDLLRLLAPDGMIFIDDIYYHGFIEGEDYPGHKHRTIITAMRALIAEITADKLLKSKLIKAGDGVMFIEYRK